MALRFTFGQLGQGITNFAKQYLNPSNPPNINLGNGKINFPQANNPIVSQPTGVIRNGAISSSAVQQQAPSTNLTGRFANVNGTIYNTQTNQAYSNPQDFFNAAGVNSFNGLQFDKFYQPPSNHGQAGQSNNYPSGAVNAGAQDTSPAYLPSSGDGQLPLDINGNPMQFGASQQGAYPSAQVTPDPASSGNVMQGVSATSSNVSDTNQTTSTPTTLQDVQKKIQDNIDNGQSFLNNFKDALTPSQSLLDLQNKQAQYDAQVTQATGQAEGILNPNNQAIPLEFLQGQGRSELFQAQQAQGINAALLNYAQGNRKLGLEAAQGAFNAYSTNLNNQIDILSKLSPQNLGIQHNDNTGDTYVTTKDPFTGKITQQYLGNTGAGAKNLTSQIIGQHFDTNTGQMVNDYGIISSGSDGIPQITPISGGQTSLYGGSTGAGEPGIVGGSTDYQVQIPSSSRLAAVNNNPGNLKYVGQHGATLGEGGFAKFATPNAGFAALMQQITIDSNRGLNLGQFINKYAPPSENDTAGYINFISQRTGANASTPLSKIPLNTLAVAMADKESSSKIVATSAQGSGQPYQAGQGASQYDQLAQLKALFPSASGNALRTTVDGTPYMIKESILPQLAVVTGSIAGQHNIPILDSTDASAVKNIDVTKQNLEKIQNLIPTILPATALGRNLGGARLNLLKDRFQTDTNIASFKNWRDTAINTIQALAGGSGSGFRLNQAEIDTATSNIPTITDTQGVAQKKLDVVNSLLETKLSEWLPNYQQKGTQQAPTGGQAYQVNGQTYTQGPDGLYYAN